MTTHKTFPKAVIIGAGIGGLSAAIRLAQQKWQVTIIEQLERPGGKMGQVQSDGYRWDIGPSVITMRHVFERLFHEAGRRLEDYLDLVPLNPITRYFWRDGLTLDATADREAMCTQIAQFSPRDVDAYIRFMAYVRRLYEVIGDPFLYRQRPGLHDLLRLPLTDVFKIDALRSMHTAIRAHFHDPHLVQLFDRFATYNGSSPYLAPATLNVIAYVEMALGAWYPRGGVYQLALALERLALELGVEIRYNCAAQRILLNSNRADAVLLHDGHTLPAKAIICNADVTHARKTLFPSSFSDQHQHQTLAPSCSGLALLVKVPATQPQLAHHNIFFGDPADYGREFDDIFHRHLPPNDPTLYVCITSKTDPDHAPIGCENWFVLANMPYLGPNFDWQTQGAAYIEKFKIENLKLKMHHPQFSILNSQFSIFKTMTPQWLQNTYGGNCGAIYGFSSNSRTAAFMRPSNRIRGLHGVYFAGGSAHPGGGVPLVALSGIAAAECAASV